MRMNMQIRRRPLWGLAIPNGFINFSLDLLRRTYTWGFIQDQVQSSKLFMVTIATMIFLITSEHYLS